MPVLRWSATHARSSSPRALVEADLLGGRTVRAAVEIEARRVAAPLRLRMASSVVRRALPHPAAPCPHQASLHAMRQLALGLVDTRRSRSLLVFVSPCLSVVHLGLLAHPWDSPLAFCAIDPIPFFLAT